MGNSIGRASHCFAGDAGEISRRHNDVALEPLDEGLGHSFCYVRPDPPKFSFSSSYSEEDYSFATTTFRSISGASVSANTSTPVSTSLADLYMYGCSSSVVDRAASFASSTSFASTPLQPVPRCSTCGLVPSSGPMAERGFISGPMERGFLSGPIDRGLYSSPTENKVDDRKKVEENVSTINNGKVRSKKRSLFDIFKKMKFRKIFRAVAQDKDGGVRVKEPNLDKKNGDASGCHHVFLKGVDGDEESEVFMERKNLQWAQGKAGEDRVQVLISEEHGWLFVGIYDGFNGPDAPEFLVSNLYSILHMELKGLLWNDKEDEVLGNGEMGLDLDLDLESNPKRKQGKCSKSLDFESDGERIELDDKKLKRETGGINHSEVLKALSEALRKTEDAYLEIADKMVSDNPELALMGSCVLVMLMKGEDVYLMNVGDSRAVLAQEAELDLGPRKMHQDLKRINEEILSNHNTFGGVGCGGLINSISLQLTTDHSTHVEEEVQRIRNDHPDDASAIINDRVKGYLKVTRAFGVGFLKQPKWNDALLEIFRINYVGTSSYITCFPSLYHYRLGPRDRFLILSSDGLYQYFTNEEAVSQVESFIASFPEGDPAQHLIEEVLFRAAKKAGLDFHELLDIRQGERRRYHDDVSVIIVSLEGRIWRSSI